MKGYRELEFYREYPQRIFKQYSSRTYQVMYMWNMFTNETKRYINALRKYYNKKHRKHYKEGNIEMIIEIYTDKTIILNAYHILYAFSDIRYKKRMLKGAEITSLTIGKFSIPPLKRDKTIIKWRLI